VLGEGKHEAEKKTLVHESPWQGRKGVMLVFSRTGRREAKEDNGDANFKWLAGLGRKENRVPMTQEKSREGDQRISLQMRTGGRKAGDFIEGGDKVKKRGNV